MFTSKSEQNIIEKIEDLFLNYGIKSISMDEISRHLGISKKTLYQYVDNKADLIQKVISGHIHKEIEALEKIKKAAPNAISQMIEIAWYIKQQLRKLNPSTVYDLQKYYPESWDLLNHYHKENVFELIRENMNWGIEEGIYRADLNVEIISRLYVSVADIIINPTIFPSPQFNLIDLHKEYMSHHLRGIISPEGMETFEREFQKISE